MMEAVEKALEHQENGESEEAAQCFVQAEQYAPTDHRLPDEAGNLYLYALDRPLDAIPCYERALGLVEDPPRIGLKLGLAHSLAGHDEAALAVLGEVGREDPTNPMLHLELGKHHLTQGRAQDAVEYFDTAIAHYTMANTFGGALDGPTHPPQVLALALMGKARACMLHLDREADGMAALATLLDDLDDSGRGVRLATELRDAGNPERAETVIAAVLEREPRNAEAKALRQSMRA